MFTLICSGVTRPYFPPHKYKHFKRNREVVGLGQEKISTSRVSCWKPFSFESPASGGKGSIPSCCIPEARKAAQSRERSHFLNLFQPKVSHSHFTGLQWQGWEHIRELQRLEKKEEGDWESVFLQPHPAWEAPERLRSRKRKWHHHYFTSAGNFLFLFQVLQKWLFPEVIRRRQFCPFPPINLYQNQTVPAFQSGGRVEQHLQKQPNLEGEELEVSGISSQPSHDFYSSSSRGMR